MNTNEHEYYFRSDKLFVCHFSLLFVNIRVHSWLKFFPGPGAGHKPQNPLAPGKFYSSARIEIAMSFQRGYNSPTLTQPQGDLNYTPSSHRIPDGPSTRIADYGISATVGRPKYRDRDRSVPRQSHRLGQT